MTSEVAAATQPNHHESEWPHRAILALTALLAGAFLYAGRHEFGASLAAGGQAQAGFLALALALSIGSLAAYAGLLRASLSAFGLSLPAGRAARLGSAVHFSNISIPNSAGLGGLPLVLAEARRAGTNRSAAAGGLVACAQLGHLVFAAVLALAVALAAYDGQLSRVEVIAAAMFGLYTLATLAATAAALHSEQAFLRIQSLPRSVLNRIRAWLGRGEVAGDLDAGRQLYASIGAMRLRPRAFATPLAFALGVEAAGVACLWATLHAFGGGSLTTALLAYAATILFSSVGFLPAGIGFAEAGLGLALANAGTEQAAIPLVVVTYRVFETWLPFAIGGVAAHSLSRSARAARPRPGLSAGGRRRLAALVIAALGSVDILLAASHHPWIRLGPMHERIPHAAVESSRYALLAAGTAMLASVPGLLHGKRQAWLISVAAVSAALIAHPFKRADYVGIAANGAGLAMLAMFVRCFPARSDPVRMRQGVAWLFLGEFGVLLYGVAGLYLLDRHFADRTTFLDSLEDGVRLLFVLPASTIEPVTRHGRWFIDSVRAGAIGVLLVSVYHFVHPVIHRVSAGREERHRVSVILERWATAATDHFHLLPDKSYFFASEGEAFIGYRVVGHAAVALGGPVGEPSARVKVVEEFAEFCDLNGWLFCFHQATPEVAAELRSLGLVALKIGEEAVIPVAEFSLAGRPFKHVRNVTNRLAGEGYRFAVLPPPIAESTVAELEQISNSWLAQGEHRERAFSLGAFSRSYVRDCAVAVVCAPGGRIEAFANLIPAYRSGQGNFDMMRRRSDSPDGAMDFLFVGMIEHFRVSGFAGMNLGLAPLANIEGNGVAPVALRLIYQHAGRVFNFRGLRQFKEKWGPRWEPRFLVFRSEMQLPALALAVTRAGERSGRLPIAWPALVRGRRQPVSATES